MKVILSIVSFIGRYPLLIIAVAVVLTVWGMNQRINNQAEYILKLSNEVNHQQEIMSKALDVIDVLATRQKENAEALKRLNEENAIVLANARTKHQTMKESAKNETIFNDWFNTALPDGLGQLLNNQTSSPARSKNN